MAIYVLWKAHMCRSLSFKHFPSRTVLIVQQLAFVLIGLKTGVHVIMASVRLAICHAACRLLHRPQHRSLFCFSLGHYQCQTGLDCFTLPAYVCIIFGDLDLISRSQWHQTVKMESYSLHLFLIQSDSNCV